MCQIGLVGCNGQEDILLPGLVLCVSENEALLELSCSCSVMSFASMRKTITAVIWLGGFFQQVSFVALISALQRHPDLDTVVSYTNKDVSLLPRKLFLLVILVPVKYMSAQPSQTGSME